MRQIALLSLLALVLEACGAGAPSTGQPTPPLPIVQPTAAVPTIPPLPTREPAAAPAPEQPAEPAGAPADSAGQARGGYAALVLLKGAAVMLEETARQYQSGQLQGAEGAGRLIGIGAILSSADQQLGQDAPAPGLQQAWDAGRGVAPLLRDVLTRWLSNQISAANVPGALQPAQERIDSLLADAERSLAEQYGIDGAELARIREGAIAKLRQSLQGAPTPAP
ncbi:MAG: hypothetical protein IPO81_07115 [Kouleothrix sp.]|nr:hypothetical protein [Kouleothrix sp.]